MKRLLILVAVLVPLLTDAATDYLANLSVSPYATVRHVNITDGSVYGSGLELGYGVNPFVSILARATAYETDDWGGTAIDETSLLVRARLVKNASESFSLYGLASGDRSWDREDWAFGAGLGVQLRISKQVSLFVDSRLRAWFNDREDLATTGGLSISF